MAKSKERPNIHAEHSDQNTFKSFYIILAISFTKTHISKWSVLPLSTVSTLKRAAITCINFRSRANMMGRSLYPFRHKCSDPFRESSAVNNPWLSVNSLTVFHSLLLLLEQSELCGCVTRRLRRMGVVLMRAGRCHHQSYDAVGK